MLSPTQQYRTPLTEGKSFSIPGTVTIHQPHFLPWLPYVARTASASAFVVLDDVQYRKRYYENRTLVRTAVSRRIPRWLAVPVTSSTRLTIADVCILHKSSLPKIARTLAHRYSKARYFNDIWPFYEPIFHQPYTTILKMNLDLLTATFRVLEIQMPPIYYSSAITTTTCRTQRIIDLCTAVGLYKVLIGWGASRRVHNMRQLHANGIDFVSLPRNTGLWRSFRSELGITILDPLFIHGRKIVVEQIAAFAQAYSYVATR